MTPEQVIKRPIILTEKSRVLQETGNQVVFEVDRRANKIEIRNAVQSLFKVTVTDVNTLVTRGKMRRMGRGFLVTEQLGHGVNAVTGDYSRGAAGFWVEDGEIAHPVEEVTIAGNLRTMFRDIDAIGRDVDRRGSRHVGSVLVGRMTVGGR